jgi:hypothetical protein
MPSRRAVLTRPTVTKSRVEGMLISVQNLNPKIIAEPRKHFELQSIQSSFLVLSQTLFQIKGNPHVTSQDYFCRGPQGSAFGDRPQSGLYSPIQLFIFFKKSSQLQSFIGFSLSSSHLSDGGARFGLPYLCLVEIEAGASPLASHRPKALFLSIALCQHVTVQRARVLQCLV